MKSSFFLVFCLFLSFSAHTQDEARTILRGKVLYRNSNVVNENVINTTSERATITNDNGEFTIRVKEGDQLVFTAVNYQLQIVTITQEILDRNRLVVEVNEKVTELDEVVLTPEDQERFIQMKNEKLKGFEYEIDRSTEVENIATPQHVRGMQDGLNFVNIFKALFAKGNSEEDSRPNLKVSEVLRQVYDDEFFVLDLKLPQDKIDAFLVYCDTQMPAQSLLRKENEFQLIDFLVTHSETFRKSLDEGK
ncbi:MAG: carboxypeptidase-like regulatory domain-containing protein [Bacteroidota bacterium]